MIEPNHGAAEIRSCAAPHRSARENMTGEELVIFDILTRPAVALSADERIEVKKVIPNLLNRRKNPCNGKTWRTNTMRDGELFRSTPTQVVGNIQMFW